MIIRRSRSVWRDVCEGVKRSNRAVDSAPMRKIGDSVDKQLSK
jgi:hypothetical protein